MCSAPQHSDFLHGSLGLLACGHGADCPAPRRRPMSQHPSRAGVAGRAPREAPAGVGDEPFQRPSSGSCGLPEAWRREVNEPHPRCSSNERETSPRRTRRGAGAGTGGSSSQRAQRSPASTSPGRVCPRGERGAQPGRRCRAEIPRALGTHRAEAWPRDPPQILGGQSL